MILNLMSDVFGSLYRDYSELDLNLCSRENVRPQ